MRASVHVIRVAPVETSSSKFLTSYGLVDCGVMGVLGEGPGPQSAKPICNMLISDGNRSSQLHLLVEDKQSFCAASDAGFKDSYICLDRKRRFTECNPGYHSGRRTTCYASPWLVHAIVTRSRRPHGSPLPFGTSFRISHPNSSSGFSASIPKQER